jgi:hypothetical protein
MRLDMVTSYGHWLTAYAGVASLATP